MSDSVRHEIWQVDVGGQVYEADLAELASWVAEGALQPEDQVRRGNLRWIEAKKVPTLIPHFNAKRDGTPPPVVVVSVTNGAEKPAVKSVNVPTAIPSEILEKQASDLGPVKKVVVSDPEFCCNHASVPSLYLCSSCDRSYCKGCPNSYGSSVKICPSCGGLCNSKADVGAAKQKDLSFQQAADRGFGFGDLAAAFAYPFKFKFSLVVGALMFMFFSLGQGATNLGGIFMFVAAIFSFMLANMLIFGVLAHTADSFSQGKIGVNFMPSFDDFSIWDDVLHPFFLWIGVAISSFGLFVVMVAIGGYMVYSSIASEQQALLSAIGKLPGTPYYGVQKTVDQSEQVKKMLADVKKQNDQRLERIQSVEQNAASGETPLAPAPEVNQQPVSTGNSDEGIQANELIKQNQQAQLEAVIGKTPETKAQEKEEIVNRFMKLAAPLVVLAGIGLLWGLFYFPVACTVAGYTRSFAATLNPLVGLDTIKRLGFDYVKLFLMGLIILICAGVVAELLSIVFSPFDMPGFGNLPARAIGSLFNFYFWVVFFCLIGFMLFKASDRLKLYR